jgi:hypothetical protein
MTTPEPQRPVLYRVEDDWMQPGTYSRLDADLLDDGDADDDHTPVRYWTVRRVIWIIMALLALIALLASFLAPLFTPSPGLPPPSPNTRDMVHVLTQWLV